MAAAVAIPPAWLQAKQEAEASFKDGAWATSIDCYTKALEGLRALCLDEKTDQVQAVAGLLCPAGEVAALEAAKLLASRSACRQKLHQWEAAVKDAEEAVTLAPQWDKAWWRLGTSLQGDDRLGDAALAFQRGALVAPQNRHMKTRAAEVEALALQGGQLQLAGAPFVSFLQSLPPSGGAAGAAAGPDSNGPPTPEEAADHPAAAAGAATASDDELKPEPEPEPEPDPEVLAEAQRQLGNEAYRESRYEEAASCFTAALALTPRSAVLHANRAAAELMRRRFKAAAEDGLKAVELDPAYARGYARAAKAMLLMGQYGRAEELYRAGAKIDPALHADLITAQVVADKVASGRAALEAGKGELALALAEAAARASVPAPEPAVALRVEALLFLGRCAEAASEARALTSEGDSNAPEALALRGRAMYLSGNVALAQQVLAQALRRDPDCGPAARSLKRLRAVTGGKERGNAAFAEGRYAAAHEQYTAALEADPDLRTAFMAQVLCNRAAAAAKLGRHEDALADAEAAIALDAGYAKAHVRRAQAQQAMGSFDAAVRGLENVRDSLDPEYPGLAGLLRDAKLALKKSQRVDYYGVLELGQGAGEDEVKKAYRRAALRCHPDKASEEERPAAEARFKLVGEAYGVLSDPAKRRRYDEGWNLEEIEQGGQACGHGMGGGMDPNDIFAHLFRGQGGGMGGGGFPGSGFPGGAYGRRRPPPGYSPYPF